LTDLGQAVDLALGFDQAVERVTEALSAEGFGVISRIDLDKAFRDRLGVDFRRYVILGACNPRLAHTAVSARPELGLLLPCNVVIEEVGPGTSRVRIVDARAMMGAAGLDGAPEIGALAEDASARLDRVAAALGGAVGRR
jgi:uncharacterized protein (DUF302 family)